MLKLKNHLKSKNYLSDYILKNPVGSVRGYFPSISPEIRLLEHSGGGGWNEVEKVDNIP